MKNYFGPHEFTCDGEIVYYKMDAELLEKLNLARDISGVPFVITSSYRTPESNAKVGGKPNSAHLRGTAVDIAISDGSQRFAILKGLLASGFTRIGVAKSFIHADIDKQLPAPMVWTY